ncbi:hypothetical protein [Jiangella rhizosphaerae]|uniref:hypothetical protein n=1 Tax=Jiangella rhizosphaerae TaxID=2293569 RepID=UPI0011C49A2D|nr:hypothetical protein [Jiangella rhizosphaerae]
MEFALSAAAIAALLLAIWAAWYVRRAVADLGRSARESLSRDGREWAGARFRLDHVSHHRYLLRNDGTSAAYGIRVDVGELVVHEGSVMLKRLAPGQSVRYLLIQPLLVRVDEIVVRWHDRPECLDSPRVARLPLHAASDHPERQGA